MGREAGRLGRDNEGNDSEIELLNQGIRKMAQLQHPMEGRKRRKFTWEMRKVSSIQNARRKSKCYSTPTSSGGRGAAGKKGGRGTDRRGAETERADTQWCTRPH